MQTATIQSIFVRVSSVAHPYDGIGKLAFPQMARNGITGKGLNRADNAVGGWPDKQERCFRGIIVH